MEGVIVTTPTDERLTLPRFQEALRRYPDQPSDATSWRWRSGIIPPAIRFLIDRPDLLEALSEDAKALEAERAPQAA